MANLQDVIERLKDEGQLTRNTGTNSIKQTNVLLKDANRNLTEISKSLGAIRTVGLRGSGGGGGVAAAGGGGTAAAATPAVAQQDNRPEGIGGLLAAAIRNQTVGRAERAADAVADKAAQLFRESALGKGVAATQQFVGERVEGTKEGLRGLAGVQTNKERDDLLRKSAEEENATREAIDKLVEVNTAMLGLSEDEAQALRQNELRSRDLASGSGGSAAPATPVTGGEAAAGGSGGKAGKGGSGGKVGGTIGKFFGGVGGGIVAGFVQALGNAITLKAAGFFALVMPLIGVGLAGFVAALGLGFSAAAAIVGKGLEVLGPPLEDFSGTIKAFEKIDGDRLSIVGNGIANFFDGFSVAGLLKAKIVPTGLDSLADALIKMNDVDASKLKLIGPAVEEMGNGLQAAGLGEVFSALSGGEGIEGQMTSLANGFKQFDGLNADDLAKIGPAVEKLGSGLKAAGDAGGFGNALGKIVSGLGSFFGAEEADPIEMFKKFAVLGEGEMAGKLTLAGDAVSGIGEGLAGLSTFNADKVEDVVDNIIPPLTKLGNAFNNEVFLFAMSPTANPIKNTIDALGGLKEVEKLKGTTIKTNLEEIGEGFSAFAGEISRGDIAKLAALSKAFPKAAAVMFGGGGEGQYEEYIADDKGTIGINLGQETRIGGTKFDPSKPLTRMQAAALAARHQQGNRLTPEERQKLMEFQRSGKTVDRSMVSTFQSHGRLREQAAELDRRGLKSGTFIAGKFFDPEAGLTNEQAAALSMKKRMGNQLRPEQQKALDDFQRRKAAGKMNSVDGNMMNGASSEIAAGQRGGGPSINAPTDNSNNSTNVTNVNNGGGNGPPPSPRRSQIRGGMYNQSEHF